MSAVVDFVSDVVSDVADVVVGAVEDVGDFVVDQIIEPVAEVVTKTIDQVIEDPISAIAMAASVAFPPFAPLIQGANTIVHGGSIEDAFKSAAIGYVGGQVAQGVSGAVGSAATEAGLEAATAKTFGNIAGNVAGTTVRGGDPLTALVSGGVGAGVNELTGQIEGFDELPASAQRAVKTVMASELLGRDPTNALVNQALNLGIKTAMEYTPPTTGDGTVNFADYPVQDFGEGNAEKYLDEYQKSLLEMAESGGYSTQWVADEEGNRTLTYDDGSTITVDPFGYVAGTTNATDTPYVGTSSPSAGLPTFNFSLGQTGGGGTSRATGALRSVGTSSQQPTQRIAAPQRAPTPSSSGLSSLGDTSFGTGSALSNLKAGLFAAKSMDGTFQDPLAEFRRVQQQKPTTYDDSFEQPQMQTPAPSSVYTYGQEQSIDDILGSKPADIGFAGGGLATPLMASGGSTGTRHGRYANGGLSTPMVASGGKMRVDFRKGDAVTGEGDGQSDDIPAMLADGEFVFPADVVAAIGNGSTKAGSDKLYDMMHGIRSHVRSAKPKDLPPEIKSPLAFLKFNKARG